MEAPGLDLLGHKSQTNPTSAWGFFFWGGDGSMEELGLELNPPELQQTKQQL